MNSLPKYAVVLLVFGLAFSPQARSAPTLIDNVHGYTLIGLGLRQFNALVFDHGKVIRTGDAEALRKAFPAAQVIDGQGKTLLPGLIDAHGHVMALGFEYVQIQLSGTESLREAQDRIRAYAKANPNRTWLLGDGWNQVKWRLGRFPLANELDAAVSDRPVVLDRADGHANWLNTRALQAAGITRDCQRRPDYRLIPAV